MISLRGIKTYFLRQIVNLTKVLVTGSAGFIGADSDLRLLKLESPLEVAGLDSVNNYYDIGLKEYRPCLISDCT